jgi:dTDP-4-dehydrorhamnose 3,5-epimerase
MKFEETPLRGAFVVELERLQDERGFFARSFCEREFAAHGLDARFVQCNVSYNARANTLRGMHYQKEPHGEGKLVRCTMGAIYDVIVDVRPGSPTRWQWFGVELSADNRRALFIPRGFAHGFQTLLDHSEVFYQMSEFFAPGSAEGLRWNDPAIGIRWPLQDPIVSARDREHPLLDRNAT